MVEDSRYAAPEELAAPETLSYAGFWIRVWASVIDSLLLAAVTVPLLFAIYGRAYLESDSMIAGTWDVLLNYLLPAIAIVVFWIYRQATPGKMVIHARVVDANTGLPATRGQYIGRYLGYFVSTLPLGLGLLWVAFDPRKQGWHDKMAGTVVVRSHAT